MKKVHKNTLDQMEQQYSGIQSEVNHFEAANLPLCSRCGSDNTAVVRCGIIGRSISIAAATTKIKLIPNGPGPGKFFCNACKEFFGE
jgi:hypothetical protein